MALVQSPSISTNGLVLCVDAANPRSSLGSRSIINWNNWVTGSGGIVGYNQNGATAENQRVSDTNPWGNTDVVWEARPLAQTNDDGGWNTDWFNIDNTKLYRYSVWVRRTSSTGGGTFYFGMYANGSGSVRMDNSTVETNAYWECTGTSNLTQNQWYLWVGHVYPANTTYTGRNPQTGYYTTAGFVGNIGGCNIGTGDLKWSYDSTQGIHRTYLYYCPDNTTRLQFYQPRVDVCDGTEPSIQALLQNAGNKWVDVSGNSSTGTITNGQSYTSGINGYFTYDGTSNYVTIPNSTALQVADTFTISAWVYPTSLAGRYGIFSTRVVNTAGSWQLEVGTATGAGVGRVAVTGLSTWIFESVDNAVSTNNWYHICFVKTNNATQGGTLYVNGTQISSVQTTAYTILNNSDNKVIAQGTNSSQYFSGRISVVSLYNVALTSTQVTQNFNATRGRYGV
jgi:hypothetical protein